MNALTKQVSTCHLILATNMTEKTQESSTMKKTTSEALEK